MASKSRGSVWSAALESKDMLFRLDEFYSLDRQKYQNEPVSFTRVRGFFAIKKDQQGASAEKVMKFLVSRQAAMLKTKEYVDLAAGIDPSQDF